MSDGSSRRIGAGTRVIGGVAAVAVAVSGCGSGAVAQPTHPAALGAPAPTLAAGSAGSAGSAGRSSIDQLTATAKARYVDEVSGAATHRELRRIARDPALRAALQPGSEAALRAYVSSQFTRVWYHEHVSRLRIMRRSRIVVERGVPFVVAPSTTTLRDDRGRVAGTLQISMQDVIGFVRYMHRNYPVDVVVRGNGSAHIRSSLPAADPATLPDRGSTTIAGRRYGVRSFQATALDREALKIWILTPASPR